MKKFILAVLAVVVLSTMVMADGSDPMPICRKGNPFCTQVR